jgi:hypothetical protein
MIETIPDEMLAPYMGSSELSEEEKAKSGPSYRKLLMERRQKLKGAAPAAASDGTSTSETEKISASATQATESVPPQVVEQPVFAEEPPTPVESIPKPPAEVQPVVSEVSAAVATPSPPAQQASATVTPEETRQKIRTLMGLILKHRGGPGFGKGRLKGPEIDMFENLFEEVGGLLREEAKMTHPVDNPLISTKPQTIVDPTPVHAVATLSPPPAPVAPSASAPANIDSTIACIEGAITMYKNCPPELQSSVLFTLRAALQSAVDTCNVILVSQPPPAIAANPDGRIDNTIAVIDGAITMYKNSPPALKESVLVTLRAALISAVETCSSVVGVPPAAVTVSTPAAPPPPVTAPAPVAPPASAVSPVDTPAAPSLQNSVDVPVPSMGSPALDTDPNSMKLEVVYEKVVGASGDGRLGLRSDLTPDEANELADQLVEMRKTLMAELETGIPDGSESAIPAAEPVVTSSTGVQESSSASKYKEMLAKARAEKAAA